MKRRLLCSSAMIFGITAISGCGSGVDNKRRTSSPQSSAQDLATYQDKQKTIDENIKELEKEIKDLREKIIELNNNNSSLTTRNFDLDDEIKNLNLRINALDKEKNKLEDDKITLDQTIEKLKGDKTVLDQKIKNLEGDKSKLEGDKIVLDQKIKNLEGDKSRLEGDKTVLDQKIKNLEGDKSKLEGDKIVLDQTIKNLEGDKSRLEGDKTVLDQTIKNLEGDKSKLEGDKTVLDQTIKNLEGDKSRLELENTQLTETKKNLENELNLKIRKLEADNTTLKGDKNKLNEDISKLRQELDNKTAELKLLKEISFLTPVGTPKNKIHNGNYQGIFYSYMDTNSKFEPYLSSTEALAKPAGGRKLFRSQTSLNTYLEMNERYDEKDSTLDVEFFKYSSPQNSDVFILTINDKFRPFIKFKYNNKVKIKDKKGDDSTLIDLDINNEEVSTISYSKYFNNQLTFGHSPAKDKRTDFNNNFEFYAAEKQNIDHNLYKITINKEVQALKVILKVCIYAKDTDNKALKKCFTENFTK